MKEEFDFESIKNKAIEQLKAGKPLLGKDGAFAPLLESILNAALEGEMDAHLTDEERQLGNRRNGKMQWRTVSSDFMPLVTAHARSVTGWRKISATVSLPKRSVP